ncbi:MAG: hypothetical protein ACI4SF_14265 [Oscillospiraceae bacterium]
MAATELNIHFHNPNSEEDTYKIISGVLSELCVKKVKKMIIDDNTESDMTTNIRNKAS